MAAGGKSLRIRPVFCVGIRSGLPGVAHQHGGGRRGGERGERREQQREDGKEAEAAGAGAPGRGVRPPAG